GAPRRDAGGGWGGPGAGRGPPAVPRDRAGLGRDGAARAPPLAGAEARERAVDQPRVARRGLVRAEPEPLGDTRTEAVDQHVGPVEEPAEHLASLVGLQVEHDAALVAVHRVEEPALAADIVHPPPAVALRRLPLDDLGAALRARHRR